MIVARIDPLADLGGAVPRCRQTPPTPAGSRLLPGAGLSNCCSSSASIWAPVRVIVTRLLPNGWTPKASPNVNSPSASMPLACWRDIGTDTAGVHERDNGVAGRGACGGCQLGIGDDVTEGRLAGDVARTGNRRGRTPNNRVGQRRRRKRFVLVDQPGHGRDRSDTLVAGWAHC